jgi:hypothetical protein
MGQATSAGDRQNRPERGYENAAEEAGRYDACKSLLRFAAELLKVNPPHITDQPMVDQLKKIGIVPGQSFDFDKADLAIQKALLSAREDAQELMAWAVPTLARVANYWSMNTNTMGVYGNYYLKRAIVAQVGLGANVPEDAIYPLNLGDETGKPLDGANKYTLRFAKGNTPPANAFWSVTLTTVRAIKLQTPLIGLPSEVGAVQIQCGRIARSLFPE